MDKLYCKEDVLRVGEYFIERRLGPEGVPEIVLSRKAQVVVSLPNEVDASNLRSWNQFGLFPLLAPGSRELVIAQYSGGAHCCTSYLFYQLGKEPVLLYDSGDYQVGYEPFFFDSNKDGVYEFSQPLLTFDYFDDCSHVDSAFPVATFKFDPKLGRYRPANAEFPEVALAGLSEYLEELKIFKEAEGPGPFQPVHGAYLGRVLRVLVTYLYAGQIEQGWGFFEREYQLADKASMRRKIEARLLEDKVYLAAAKK